MDIVESLNTISNLGCIAGSDFGSVGAVLGTVCGMSLPHVPELQNLIDGVVGNALYDSLKLGASFAMRRRTPSAYPPEFGEDLRGAFHEAIQLAIYDIGGSTCYPDAWKNGKRSNVPPQVDFFNPVHRRTQDIDSVREVLELLRIDAEQSRIFPSDFTPAQQEATIAVYVQATSPEALNVAFYEHTIVPRLTTTTRFRPIVPPQVDTHLRRHLFDRTLVHLRDTFADRPDAWQAFNRVLLKDIVSMLRGVASAQGDMLARLDSLKDAQTTPNLSKVVADLIAAIGQTHKEASDNIKIFMDRVLTQHSEIVTKLDTHHQEVLGQFNNIPDRVVSAVKKYMQVTPDKAEEIAAAYRLLDSMPTTASAPVHTLPIGSYMPLSANPLFTGREDELRIIASTLKGQTTVAIEQVSTAAATGLGGIGKSQLACEFVHRYGHYFAGGVFWLSFAEAASVPSEIALCGGVRALKLAENFGSLPLEDQVNIVLTAWAEPIPRLLVFDNCEDEHLLMQYRPTTGGCRVLITSRRANWDCGEPR